MKQQIKKFSFQANPHFYGKGEVINDVYVLIVTLPSLFLWSRFVD